MELKIISNQKEFKEELTLKDKIKNVFNIHKLKKELRDDIKPDESKTFVETLIVDEILEED